MAETMSREQKLNNVGYLLLLLSSAVNQTAPPEPDDEVDFEAVFKLAKRHEIANTVFYAVEKLNSKPFPQLYQKWQNQRNMCVHRYMLQSMEFESLKALFNENAIDFLPVKGFPVSNLYPAPEYRYMGDLDFLIRAEDLKKAGELVLNNGYKPKVVGTVHHDEYVKPPMMVIELHHEMVGLSSGFHDYYDDFFDKCEKVGDYEYKMSGEDLYIFQLVHLKKHFEDSGAGIRSILDMHLLNKKLLPSLESAYIDAEIQKLGLADFFLDIKELGEKWFDKNDVSKFSDLELFVITSGTYGSQANEFKIRKGDLNTAAFLKKRLFPPVNWMKDHYHVLRKHPVLLPAVYVYRIVRGVFVKKDNIKKEINVLKK